MIWPFSKNNNRGGVLDPDYHEIYKEVTMHKLKYFEEKLVKLTKKYENLEMEYSRLEDKFERVIRDQKHMNDKLRFVKKKINSSIILEPRSNSPFINPKKHN